MQAMMIRRRPRCRPAVIGFVLVLGTGAVAAQTVNCTLSTTPMAFGTYDPAVANFGTADTATGSISVRCTKGTNISIGIEQGQNALAGGACSATPARRMKEAASNNYINYNILQSSGGAAWGCGFGGPSEVTRSAGASNTIETFTTFGVIPQAQDVPSGTYSDTVNYIVTF